MALLQVSILLLTAAFVAARNDGDYTIFVPKTIRVGTSINLQYNTRNGRSDLNRVVTEIYQNSVKKYSDAQIFTPGNTVTADLDIPRSLSPGNAKIIVRFEEYKAGVLTTPYKVYKPVPPDNEQSYIASVTVADKSISVFLQTDKAIYSPSQTVNFRVIAVDAKTLPHRGSCDVEIMDAEGNKVKQWKSVDLETGTLTLKLELSDQPVLGDWTIKAVTDTGEKKEKKFTVDKYVLPRFGVEIDSPSSVLVGETQVKVTVSAKYTYGQALNGKATVVVTNPSVTYWGSDFISGQRLQPRVLEFKDLLLIDGKVDVVLNAKQLKILSPGFTGLRNGDTISVTANVTEKLTGKSIAQRSDIKVYEKNEKIQFLSSSPNYYKPGLPYTAFLKLSQTDGGVVVNPKNATISVEYYELVNGWVRPKDQTVSFSQAGLAKFTIDVPDLTHQMKISARYNNKKHDVSTSKQLSYYQSPVLTYLQLSVQSPKLEVGSSGTFMIRSSKPGQTVDYQVWSKGSIVTTGTVKVDIETSFSIQMQAEMAPSARIIAFTKVDGVIVLDSLNFNLDGVFGRNKVTVSYSKPQTKPGEKVDVKVTAVSGSFVGLLAVDQSALLLASGNDITQSEVSSELEKYDTSRKLITDQYWMPYSVGGKKSSEVLENSGVLTMISYIPRPGTIGWRHGELITTTQPSTVARVYPPTAIFPSDGPPIALPGVTGGRPIEPPVVVRNTGGIVATPPIGVFPSGSGIGQPPIAVTATKATGVRPPIGVNPSGSGIGQPPIDVLPTKGTGVRPPIGVNPSGSGIGQPPVGVTPPSVKVAVRKVFPESWLWCNMTAKDGKIIVTATVPDTITSWVASAFAVSAFAGLGVSPETAKMQVFRPFFVSLNLPYSVVRGEQLVLQAIVFNYMSRDTNVTVTLPASDEYKSIVVDASGSTRNVKQVETITIMAKANRGTTISFPIVPLTIGKMRLKVTATTSGAADAVQRDLLVEAEGVEKEYNQAILINLKNSSTFTQTVAIDFPPNVVSDSARVEFSLIGDIMGPAITGLDKLIKMPYGCGEQNMVNFAPTIFVTDYLHQTKQLTSELRTKSIGFMEKGYQRELTYQRNDGSFSAWGQRDRSGSMWLTAFVTKSFQKARDFIYVDDAIITKAVSWIINLQNSDGSFPEPGRLLSNSLSGGGTNSKVTLTAYVLTAISEVKLQSPSISSRISSAQSKAQKYLESQISSSSKPYQLALVSYALYVSGSKNVDTTLDALQKMAKREGSFQYWQQAQTTPARNNRVWIPPYRQGRATDIEMTAYVLQIITGKSVEKATPILNWISAQRNSYGGFVSTQDTVVALQALSNYAKVAFGETNMTVLASASGQSNSYNIDSINALVLQSKVLAPDTKSVTVSASGFGNALAQVSATYNVEDYEQEPAFDTIATIMTETDNKIRVRVCTRWLLGGSTGMAVKEIGIPSGFSADVEALEDENYPGLKKIEEGDRKVILYFEELGSDEKCVEVDAERTGLVAKARPVAVKVYDYYEPENQQTIFYSSTRLRDINICDVCGVSCEGCAAYFKRR